MAHFEFFKISLLRTKGRKGAVPGCCRIPAAAVRRFQKTPVVHRQYRESPLFRGATLSARARDAKLGQARPALDRLRSLIDLQARPGRAVHRQVALAGGEPVFLAGQAILAADAIALGREAEA